MNPTEPDLNHSLDGVARGVENLARVRGASRSERWFRSLVQNASDVVAILEADGTLRYISPSVERVLGYRPEEVVGSLAFDHVHPEDIELVSREFAEALETAGVLPPIEFRARAADGSWRYMETILNNLLDDPAVRGLVANSRDVTERKEAEEALKRREEHFRSLVQNASDVILIMGPDQTVRYVSPAVEWVLGYKPEQVVGHDNFTPVHPDDMSRVQKLIDEAMGNPGTASWMELRLRHADGSWRYVETACTNLLGDPAVGGIVFNSRDITERKEAEEALRESEERYRRRSRELALLHQVRTALAQELDLQTVIYKVVEAIAETYGYTQVSAYLLEGEELVLQHEVGYEQAIERIPLTEGVSGRAVRTGQPILLEDVRTDPDFLGSIEGLVSEICIPLFDEGEVVGFLNVESTGGVKLSEADLRLMAALGQHVSVAVSRARLHTQVRESEKRFRAMTQNSSDLVTLLRADGTIRYQSAAIERMLGYSTEELVGENAFNYVHPEDLGRVEIAFAEGLKDPSRRPSAEYRFHHKDGLWVWLESVGTNLLEDPGVGEFVVNSRDVTERRRAEKALKESEERFRSSFRDAATGMALVGIDGRWLQVNRALCQIVGYPREELLEKTFQGITHPDDLDADVEQMHRMLAGEIETYQMEKRYIHKEGHVVWILLSVSLVHDEEGEPLYFVSQIQDITERKRAESNLREAEERYRTVVEEQTELVCRFLPDLTLTFVNDAYCRYFGKSTEELIGSSFMQHISVEDQVNYQGPLFQLTQENSIRTVEHRVLTPDGEVRWQQWTDRAILDEEGRLVEYQSVGRDITERKTLEERLEHLAFHDPLTDLPNRPLFVDRLEQVLKRTRHEQDRRVAVLFMDLDGFKVVNDSLGHEVGDRLLIAVAERLRSCLRPEDILARFGGDEFVLLLEDVESPEDAVRVAERLVAVLLEPFTLLGRELFVTVSIGVALSGARWKRPEDLLRDADTAMYEAKAESASGYRVFDPAMHERILGQLELENDIRRAMEAEEFVLHYQPIVDLESGEVWGAETLVRWEHPERGLLDPFEFVPLAEQSGIVVPLGEGVLREACRRAKRWQEEHPNTRGLVLSVNLSASQLQHPDLAKTIGQTLHETGLEPGYLSLDITETMYIKTLERDSAVLNEVKQLGVRISIDDFGVGYSSLSYLKWLPADILKIDRSFVKGIGMKIEDTAIVRMVIDLAHTLGMKVVAEGVESEEHVTLLKEMGCDLAQGFHFSEPLPPEEVPGFFAV